MAKHQSLKKRQQVHSKQSRVGINRTSKKYSIKKGKSKLNVKYIQIGGEPVQGSCDPKTTLGSGKFGVTYKCVIGNDTVAVLKVSINGNDDDLNNEKNTFLALGDHMNNNIVKSITDDGIIRQLGDQRKLHIYLEYCDKGSLVDYMKPPKPDKIEDIYKQIFNGLKYLYTQQIIHSDIKAANILVKTKDNTDIFKIADFGCAVNIKELAKTANDGYINRTLLFKKATQIITPNYLRYSTYFRDLYALYCLIWYLHMKEQRLNKLHEASIKVNDSGNMHTSTSINTFITNLKTLETSLANFKDSGYNPYFTPELNVSKPMANSKSNNMHHDHVYEYDDNNPYLTPELNVSKPMANSKSNNMHHDYVYEYGDSSSELGPSTHELDTKATPKNVSDFYSGIVNPHIGGAGDDFYSFADGPLRKSDIIYVNINVDRNLYYSIYDVQRNGHRETLM